ncbi:MAG TPA: hypothetical protein VGQ04_22245 [Chitinophagaceae bacterium]|jgi:hypothetical protein|nr:hypothetical protein [Chitinophagaceae bacterium]
MQTKKTKEKKSKKTVPLKAGQFFHHGVYMKNYWVSIILFLPAQSDCIDQVFIDDSLVNEKDNNDAV